MSIPVNASANQQEHLMDRPCKNSILSDMDIEKLARGSGMITPFAGTSESKPGTLSYGLTSYGYDVRLGNKFKVSRSNRYPFIDPKRLPKDLFDDFSVRTFPPWEERTEHDFEDEPVYIPPHSYILGVSYEKFKMPFNVCGICVGKSTYARCGLLVNVTPLEPGWEGHITIEIANSESVPVRIYPLEGIMQVQFFMTERPPMHNYKSRKGKYQNQPDEPVAPR